jgi:DNA modification methylase
MPFSQLPLPLPADSYQAINEYHDRLLRLLIGDLDFHDQLSNYASHNFHSFPAKFPPQLPYIFIQELTKPGEIVLDPMVGSGTTALEALLSGRRALGFDIDPLAQMITKVKTTPITTDGVKKTGYHILTQAHIQVKTHPSELDELLETRWDPRSREFINYWFLPQAQRELLALLLQIEQITDPHTKTFFELVFSAIIITKSGGVSLALDLAHTRPHRARRVVMKSGEVVFGQEFTNDRPEKTHILTKIYRSPLDEFEKRFQNNLKGLYTVPPNKYQASIGFANAQNLPLSDASIDLIITSPPYASNAIDYMRAHKFTLVWLGYNINDLGDRRGEYIGGETLINFALEQLSGRAAEIVKEISNLDAKKGSVIHRYFSEMDRVLREMYRVLKPGKAAIVVVGSSNLRGRDTETQNCLVDIGKSIGFEVPAIGVRNLDRNRRMLPAGMHVNRASQIQQRMHEEYVIGFYKP